LEDLEDAGIKYISLNTIRSEHSNDIKKCIKQFIGPSPVHISIDLQSLDLDENTITSSNKVNKNGLYKYEILNIINSIKDNIISVDITEFNPKIENNDNIVEIKQLINKILKTILKHKKENNVQTFSKNDSIVAVVDDVEFLIYRPVKQETNLDNGWYKLSNIQSEYYNYLLKEVAMDIILEIVFNETNYYITSTTMKSQQQKSYTTTTTIYDTVMYPHETK